jgi:predicted RNA-binding protein Jag
MSETQARASVTAEGYTVAEAVKKAATELNVEAMLIDWTLDKTHFRNEEGRTVPRDTVRIIATARDKASIEGAHAARDYVSGLLEKMEVEASVSVNVDGDRKATIRIDSPRARHLVGRKGVTLYAITDLLVASLARGEHADWQVRIEVEGGRDRDDDRGDRRDRRDRRDDDRGDRGDRRERRGRRDDDRRSKKNPDKLKKLARRLAQEAIDTGESVKLRQELNSFERRIVHMELSDFDGVNTESVGDGSFKHVVIHPDDGGEE